MKGRNSIAGSDQAFKSSTLILPDSKTVHYTERLMKSANKWQLRGSFQASSFDKVSDAFFVLFLGCGPFPIGPDESIF